MANNQALAFHLDSPMAMKLRKRENNLMNSKWDQVIVIEDSDDEVDLFDTEGISLWEEDNNNIDIVSNGVIVGEEVVDEIPNATVLLMILLLEANLLMMLCPRKGSK
ncbi:hypothetical protein Tco_0789918 [Tanacetum coccineum]